MSKKIELLEKGKTKIISLEYAKQYLRVDQAYDDEVIENMLEVAIEMAQHYLNRSIVQSKWRLTIYGNLPSSIELFYGPISNIVAFKIYKNDEDKYYLNPNHYFLSEDNQKICLKRSVLAKKVEIEYLNGFKENEIPAAIKQGILEHLARLYDARGSDYIIPFAAKNLYQPYKRVRL